MIGIIGVIGGPGIGSGGEPSAIDYTQDANCVAAYFMNNSNTDETDDSGNGVTLTQSGTPSIPTSTDVPAGYSGTSRWFGPSDDRLDASSSTLNLTSGALTFACWCSFDTELAEDQMLIYKYDTTGDQRQYQFKHDVAEDRIEFILSVNGTGFERAFSTSAFADYGTGWHHFAAVYNGTDTRIYIDGLLDGTPVALTGNVFGSTAPVGMGATGTGGSPLDGKLDEFIIFDRALSITEINNLIDDGVSGDNGGSD